MIFQTSKEVFDYLKERNERVLEHLKNEFACVRAGRANPRVLDRIMVNYYGSLTPLNQMANITTPDPRMLMINVWDTSAFKDVLKAINEANLGLTPSDDGKSIRLVFPVPTQDRRKELVKQAKQVQEATKITLRNQRREAIDAVKALKKDNLAMETLYNSFYKDVLYVCKKLNLNDADAYDVAQDTFIDAFSKLDTLSDKSKFKAWIIRIANNKALNLLKHNNVIKFESIDDDNSFTEIPDKAKNIEEQYIDNEVAGILRSIIEKLPLEQKITVFMYYYEDMPVKEIAEAYNCSENTVRSRLNYAKKFIAGEVNKLEDNNVKLRCSAIIPFLFILFANESEAFAASIPDSSIPSSTGVIAKTMKSLTGKTVKTLSAGKIAGISVAAIAAVAGVVIGVTSLGKKDNDTSNQHIASADPTAGTTDKDDSDKKETETAEKETYETGDEKWDYYPIDSFDMPEIEYTTIDYAGGVLSANIADTFFKLSENDIIESIKNNDLHNGNEHEFGTRYIEECEIKNFTDVGTQKRYTVTDIVYAYDKSKKDSYADEDFMYDYIISMTTDYANYNTPNTIGVNICNVNVNRDFQKKTYTLLESIFGKEIAVCGSPSNAYQTDLEFFHDAPSRYVL